MSASSSETSWAVASLLRSLNAGLALMAVTPAVVAANEIPRYRFQSLGLIPSLLRSWENILGASWELTLLPWELGSWEPRSMPSAFPYTWVG